MRRALGRLRLGHRARALAGAASAVHEPARLVAGELAFLPLRPLASVVARTRGLSPGAAWRAVARPLGGQLADHRLRASGRPVSFRRGTADVFVLHETHGDDVYAPPAEAAAALAARGPRPRIADLGANIGLFALAALGRWPHASITSWEPDPENLAVLRRNVGQNLDARWEVVPAAAGAAAGELPFLVGRFGVSRAARPGEAGSLAVPVVDALPALADADLAKIDIEGGEWPILLDERLAGMGAAAVVLEYHDWRCPAADAEALARAALEGAGYRVGPAQEAEPGAGTLWAWRPTPG